MVSELWAPKADILFEKSQKMRGLNKLYPKAKSYVMVVGFDPLRKIMGWIKGKRVSEICRFDRTASKKVIMIP